MFRKIIFFVWGLAAVTAVRAFPICMYGVNEPIYLKTLKEAGFTCVQTYQTDPAQLAPLAQAARKQKMQVVFFPQQVIGSSYEQAARNWPVLAWYLVDEPDVNRWTREQVAQAYQETKAAFPHTPTALVIGQGQTETPFYDLADRLMVDWYPVPHLRLESFGDQVRDAKAGQQRYGAGPNPLWGVVQTFDWKEFKQYRPDNDRIGRFPTQDEIRFMSYDGIINGAQGLFYFVFSTQKKPLPLARPEWWQRVTNVTREIARLRPVLEKGRPMRTSEPLAYPLAAKTWVYKKHRYTLLVNRSDGPVAAPEAFLSKKYKALFGTEKGTHLARHAVWILRSKDK